MSSASARAQARRQAILSRGSDRLAKLTTSGRGEDAPAYMHDDPPVPKLSSLSNFTGEETPPSRADPTPPFAPDPSVWSEQQQQQLMQALMGQLPAGTEPPPMPNLADNPLFANLLAASGGGDGKGGLAGGMPAMGKVPGASRTAKNPFCKNCYRCSISWLCGFPRILRVVQGAPSTRGIGRVGERAKECVVAEMG